MVGKAMATESFATTSRSARAVLLPDLFTSPLHRPTLSTASTPVFGVRRSFASSVNPPESKGFKDYKLPPVNPPDKENPDAVTLRAQWDNAVRLYGRMYSHAWGTAIMAGVVLFGVGWWVKGENPLKALDPTGEIKKEEPAKIE